ncbi:6840_t:CDS:1 [Ambispora gerdemannii]|uniref:6840_t:CDS:1 n=1 Tax=Ambispora gerdemannii TaxID=144530 RepID=A0A9N9G5I7_9GLOM|nr:6840_t:CDS:1 [Ambispora gerdemannii]
MSRSSYKLTRRETKGLIDISQIPSERYDFSLILTCARILYRVQLKFFSQDSIKNSEINEIITREIDRIQHHSNASLKYPNSLNDSDTGIIFNYGNQLASAEKPLEIMRSMLTGDTYVRIRSRETAAVRRVYKNLVTLIDDLQMAKNASSDPKESNENSTSKRLLFRHINFAVTDSLISEDEANSAFIEPPLPLLWLPTLTNGEKVTQRKTSAFALRKRKGFTNSSKFRNRLLRMPHVQAITGNSRANSSGNDISMKCLRKKRKIEKPQRKSIIIDIEEDEHAIHHSSLEPEANMANKRDAMSIEFLASNSIQLPSISNVLRNALLSSHRSAFTRILSNNTSPHGPMYCCNHNLKKNLRQLCPCISMNAPRVQSASVN